MRALLIACWLLTPIGVGLWHYGPGQEYLQLDHAGAALARAEGAVQAGDWETAVREYDAALQQLPAGRTAQSRRIRLERAKARMQARQLPTAHADLKALVQELQADAAAEPALLAEARSSQAQAQYYMTWLMRLEGLAEDVWQPEIESARQTYRLLAEQAAAAGDQTAARKNRADLESAVRLARLDLGELQGLPLPSQ